MLYSIIGILVIILDQLVKFWVDSNINYSNPINLIPNVLTLVRVQNDGAAFSFLSGGSARIWFIGLTAVFAILVVLALATNFVSGRFGRWCLVFITAGGLSNMIDRVRFGYVIDMFKFELFDFAVFNVADIFITVFCIAFIIYILFGGEKEKDPQIDEFDDDDYEEEVRPRRARTSRSKTRNEDVEEIEEDESPRRSRKKARKTAEADEDVDFKETETVRPNRQAASSRNAASSAARTSTAKRVPASRDGAVPSKPQNSGLKEETSSSRNVNSGRAKIVQDQDAMFEEMFAPKQTSQPSSRPVSRQAAAAASSSRRPSSAARPSNQDEDPFAEWEKANARVTNSGRNAYRQVAETIDKAKTVSSDAQDAYSEFIAASTPVTAKKPAAKQAPKVETPAKAQTTKAPVSDADEFDLDSILNEFK